MEAGSRSLEALLSLVDASASGELLCRSALAEVHVHLRHGRIAWAAALTQQPAFMEHLRSTAGVQPERLRQVLSRCRSERLSLGNALMESGLTTLGGLRGAFSGQIAQAIAQLVAMDRASTRFTIRNYDHYDARLTFDVRDFIADDGTTPCGTSVQGGYAALAGQLLLAVEGLLWAEVFDGAQWVDAAPPAPRPRTPAALLRDTLLDGADFAAVRTTRAALVGLALTERRSLWCRVSSDATFGSAVSAIAAAASVSSRARQAPPAQSCSRWLLGDGKSPSVQALSAFLERSRDLLGAILLDDGGNHALAGCGVTPLVADACVDLARRRARCLALPASAFAGERERPLDSLCVSAKSMVSGEAGQWCFGTQLMVGEGESLWLFFHRQVSQGLGWAYLSALSRALTRGPLESTG